jgi:putative aldouronate transport system permease protein
MCGIVLQFVSYDGLINELLLIFGIDRVNFMTTPGWFYPIFTAMGIWENMGWDSIIYLAALSSIDQSLYESAAIDGAGRFRQIFSITLPGLLPTIIIMLILSSGYMMNVSLEKVLLLYNPSIYSVADVLSTHVYRRGIIDASYSYAAAVGLFNSLVNCTLLLLTNKLSKKVTETGLF